MGIFDKNSSAGLREKYSRAIQTAKSLHMQGGAEERDGKLHFNGTVNSVEEKNQIWNALKTVSTWEKEVVADIKVNASAAARPAPTTGFAAHRQRLSPIPCSRRHPERHCQEVPRQRE